MPKMKTNAAAKKRFTFTGTGKIKRKHAYHSHILTKKTTKQKRNLCYSGTVSAADEAKIKNLLVKYTTEGRTFFINRSRTAPKNAGEPHRCALFKNFTLCHVQSMLLRLAQEERKF